MYRKSDQQIFSFLSVASYILALCAFVLIIIYHFMIPETNYRWVVAFGLSLSVFMQFQTLLLKVHILQIRVSNLMDIGSRPGKLEVGTGNVALIIYAVLFWISLIGLLLSFMPADWRPAFMH